jgi:hypothetical protein
MSDDRCLKCGHKECRCCTSNIFWGGDDCGEDWGSNPPKKKKKPDCWACPNAKIKKKQCGICFREWGSMNKEK